MGGVTLAKSSHAATLLSVKLQWSSATHDCQALIDSGAKGNLLGSDLAHRLKLPVVALSQPIVVHARNSSLYQGYNAFSSFHHTHYRSSKTHHFWYSH